jgi:cobalt-zinc-cadmium efflux system membrane fusion protein
MLRSTFRATRPYLFTLAVLGVMAALAVWGHHSRWTVPKFGELLGATPAADPGGAAPALKAASATAGDFPVLVFDDRAAVRENGLEFAEVAVRPLEDYVNASAVVDYNQLRLAQLSARVSGHIWSVRTEPGQAVKAGDVLALVDAEEVGKAKADFLQETVAAWHRANYLKRLQGIQDAVPARSLHDAETAVKEAELRKFNAGQRLLNLGLPLDLDLRPGQSPDDLARQVQFLGLPQEVIAEVQPRPATANLIALKAPFDGVVVQQDVVIGELIRPDQPQFVIADVRTMWVKLSVRKEDAGRLDYGQRVEFLGEGLTKPVVGPLSWVSTEIDSKTRTVQARCQVDNPVRGRAGKGARPPLRLLRANLFGTARVLVARHAAAVVVPDAAVQRMPDLTPVVFVARPDGVSFEPRRVRLGLSREGITHVLDGVRAGERVVTRGSFVLRSELMKDTLSGG